MGPAVGWVEEGSQTLLWVLNHGAVLMGLIRELHTTAAPEEPPLLSHHGDRDSPGAPPVASGVGWPGFGLWLKSHGPGKAFGMHKGGTRQVNLLNRLCKVGWWPSWRSWLGIWGNAVMEGVETLQNFSPAALGIFSLKTSLLHRKILC